MEFKLEGESGLLEALRYRLAKNKNAVIVVAEGAGQDLLPSPRLGVTEPVTKVPGVRHPVRVQVVEHKTDGH